MKFWKRSAMLSAMLLMAMVSTAQAQIGSWEWFILARNDAGEASLETTAPFDDALEAHLDMIVRSTFSHAFYDDWSCLADEDQISAYLFVDQKAHDFEELGESDLQLGLAAVIEGASLISQADELALAELEREEEEPGYVADFTDATDMMIDAEAEFNDAVIFYNAAKAGFNAAKTLFDASLNYMINNPPII